MPLEFEPIDMRQQDAYQEKLALCRQIASDYSFINLWGWGPDYGLQWAWSDGLVWLKQSLPQKALWAPVGDWSNIDWGGVLEKAGTTADRIIRVPEALQKIWLDTLPSPPGIEETRGQWDYLYDRQALAELKGNRYHKKKNLLNQFIKKYDHTYFTFSAEMVEQALAMQEDWCTWRDCESDETLAAENKAIERVLKQWPAFKNITGGAIRVGQQIAAYTIAEAMPDRTLVIHFEKGNPEYKGSYQAINQMFLQKSADAFERVNREQDLDNEGLRKAKLSYHPIDFVRKYQAWL